jgi:glutaredoxin
MVRPATAQGASAQLYRMVMPDHLCPYGLKSKALLERKGFRVEDHHLTTRDETDAFQRQHQVSTTPQVWIDGQRIGGYEELRRYFGDESTDQDETTYRPVLALFAIALSIALSISFATTGAATGGLITIRTFEWFVAISMTLLALQKLQDVESFSRPCRKSRLETPASASVSTRASCSHSACWTA